MKRNIVKKTYLLASIMVFGCMYQSASANSANPSEEQLAFNVYLDDRFIGNHEVRIVRNNNTKSVNVRADFDVRFMLIPVYSYNHESRELWKDGCVENIRTSTNDNGDDYFIKTTYTGNGLEIETNEGAKSLQGCVRTYAYWNPALLTSKRLLNTQNGKYQEVSITDLGINTLILNDLSLKARKYRLVSDDAIINLWYTDDMRWLALETETRSGALLRYLPKNHTIAGLN